jgi:hypothetical protein
MTEQRIVALEEHLMFPNLTAEIPPELIAARGFADGGGPERMKGQLADVGAGRVAAMDAAGIARVCAPLQRFDRRCGHRQA